MSTHRKVALAVITAAVVLDTGLGLAYAAVTPHLAWWHGLYCALANSVTDGGDISPANGAGYAIQALEFVLAVPLYSAGFSLFTAAVTAWHVRDSEQRIKRHIEQRLEDHLGEAPPCT
jgi:hypothetical protein